MELFSTENKEFLLSVIRCINELSENFGIPEVDKLRLVLQLIAHDRMAEVGLAQMTGEMQAIQTELLLEQLVEQALHAFSEMAAEG